MESVCLQGLWVKKATGGGKTQDLGMSLLWPSASTNFSASSQFILFGIFKFHFTLYFCVYFFFYNLTASIEYIFFGTFLNFTALIKF